MTQKIDELDSAACFAGNPLQQARQSIPILSFFSRHLVIFTNYLGGIALAANVAVVFLSVVMRYVFHSPIEWAEEVARALMVTLVFLGIATSSAKDSHIGIDVFVNILPEWVKPYVLHLSKWAVFAVALGLIRSSFDLVNISLLQTTETGLPQAIIVTPVFIGSCILGLVTLEKALLNTTKLVLGSLAIAVLVAIVVYAVTYFADDASSAAATMMLVSFFVCIFLGIPIAFTLGLSAMIYFIGDPSLPFVFYSQQMTAGVDHFVLLSIPFFLLAGAAMEVNGMSQRLVELIVRGMGRYRGGLNMTSVVAMGFFSGISGSKLADVAAVGGVLLPAVRRANQSPEEAAGLLAAAAVPSESIPPCVNLIILGFVANISIGALFIAGIIPAVIIMLLLLVAANRFGTRIDVDKAYPVKTSTKQLVLGAAVGLVMIFMIGRGVMIGIATSTEISAFAVVYALVVGRLVFRELTLKATVELFIRVASMAGMLMFIVAAATSLSYSLTIQMIPHHVAALLVMVGQGYGPECFMILTIVILVLFGGVLEGAPALIIFAPILVPIAIQLGFSPLHYGVVMVIAMGFGLFCPPIGIGLYTTCAVCKVNMKDIIKPQLKYLAVTFLGILIITFVPALSTWLPGISF